MRKMTKTVAVVAAMSALTVASASVAFAAVDERTNLSSLGKDASVDAAAVGEWDKTDDGWTFTVDDEELAGTWAQIDGAWYYFHKDGIMAEDELVYLEGETYYFHPDGRMQAKGWLKLDGDGDQIYEYGLDIDEYNQDRLNPVDGGGYSKVWLYFNEDGTACDDEWFSDPESDLHYYFDDIIMVNGDYDHDIDGTIYGFAADGHMYVGWEENKDDYRLAAPNKDEKVWYYYNTNGKKFVANNKYDGKEEGFAWKEIDGKWYCFMDETENNNKHGDYKKTGKSNGTLICNVYFTNNFMGTGNSKYYYVDKKGVMQTGVIELAKDTKYVTGTWATGSGKTKAKTEILLKSNGEANPNNWSGDSFYANAMDQTKPAEWNVQTYNTAKMTTQGITTYNATEKDIVAHLVKNAFVTPGLKDNNYDTYYVDKYGEKVTNSVIKVGFVTANGSTATLFDDFAEKSTAVTQYNAYVIANSKGVIYEDGSVDATAGQERTVKVGAKKYTATNFTVTANGVDLQVFFYENEN